MSSFWAMSDVDKTLLVLKILLIAFGWASMIIAAIVVMCFFMLVAKDFLEVLEERREKRQKAEYSPETDHQVAAFKLKQARRRIQNERDEFFRNVQELHNDLR